MRTVTSPVGTDRAFAGYLLFQALAGVAFWTTLSASSSARRLFEMMPTEHAVTDAFFFADVVVVIAGSAVAAWGVHRSTRWSVPLVAFVAGALVYATLYLVAWVAATGDGGWLLGGMTMPSTVTTYIAHHHWRARR